MSNFRPGVPADVPDYSYLNFNETTFDLARNNTAKTLRANSTASASVAITDTNYNGRGVVVYFTINTFPVSLSTTLALKIQSVDPVSGNFFTILAGAARSVTGTTVMMVGPNISPSALGISSYLPRDLRFLVSQSSGATSKDVTFSIGLHYTV